MIDGQISVPALARVAALSAKQRYTWADLDDMTQEAAVAMLLARPKYDALKGALEPYLLYAAWFRLMGWVWENGIVKQRPDRNNGWALHEDVDEATPAGDTPEELLRKAQLARAVEAVMRRCDAVTRLVLTGEAKLSTLVRDMGHDLKQARYDVLVARAALRAIAREHI